MPWSTRGESAGEWSSQWRSDDGDWSYDKAAPDSHDSGGRCLRLRSRSHDRGAADGGAGGWGQSWKSWRAAGWSAQEHDGGDSWSWARTPGASSTAVADAPAEKYAGRHHAEWGDWGAGRGGPDPPALWRASALWQKATATLRSRSCARSRSPHCGIPCLRPRRGGIRRRGAAILLEGLGLRLDGQVGRLATDVRGGLAEVVLPACLGAPVLHVPVSSLRPLPAGTPVELRPPPDRGDDGFERASFAGTPDGSAATWRVSTYETDRGEYCISQHKAGLAAGWQKEEGWLKEEKQAPIRPAAPTGLVPFRLLDMPVGGPGRNSHAGAGAEHACRFVDSEGAIRRFWLHLPEDFYRNPDWPLLLFLPATIGGTLLNPRPEAHSKRWTGPSKGCEFAAARFVMVTPECEWTWKHPPSTWVTELLAMLSLATWCDADRVYATGCSMGGMGCWEIVAGSPGLFAAAAPVAAYHKAERREQLVEAFRKMPAFVVHSPHDECCRFQPESALWKDLASSGNPPVVKRDVVGSHGSVWAEAYDKDTELWEFLLDHRRRTN